WLTPAGPFLFAEWWLATFSNAALPGCFPPPLDVWQGRPFPVCGEQFCLLQIARYSPLDR
ncbi:MAG: hypothetical protein ACO391_14775, partial [Pseudomonadales bacterium]